MFVGFVRTDSKLVEYGILLCPTEPSLNLLIVRKIAAIFVIYSILRSGRHIVQFL